MTLCSPPGLLMCNCYFMVGVGGVSSVTLEYKERYCVSSLEVEWFVSKFYAQVWSCCRIANFLVSVKIAKSFCFLFVFSLKA
jgi:hypothetical protein